MKTGEDGIKYLACNISKAGAGYAVQMSPEGIVYDGEKVGSLIISTNGKEGFGKDDITILLGPKEIKHIEPLTKLEDGVIRVQYDQR